MKAETYTLGDLERLLIQELHRKVPGAIATKIEFVKDGARINGARVEWKPGLTLPEGVKR
jgi:hypothetical protein